MDNTLGKTLHALRTGAGLTQKEVARRLSAQTRPITHQAVSKWETGDAAPSVAQFLCLCEMYGVRDVLGTFGLVQDDGLNDEGRRKLEEYARLLRLSGLYARAPEKPAATAVPTAPARLLRLYELPASAGAGQLLDGERYEWVEADDTVPQNASFGVRLAGDSMEPRFANGQVVWVRRQPAVEDGEIGLFLLDGEAYCKRLSLQGGVRLLSLNPRYAPIEVGAGRQFEVFGKVVG